MIFIRHKQYTYRRLTLNTAYNTLYIPTLDMDLLMQSAERIGVTPAYLMFTETHPDIMLKIAAELEEQVTTAYWRTCYTEGVVGSLNKLIDIADKASCEALEEELDDLQEQCEEAEEAGEEPPFDRWDTAEWAYHTREIEATCDRWYKDQWIDWLGEMTHHDRDPEIAEFFVDGTKFRHPAWR